MFVNPVASPLDEPFYEPAKHYNIYGISLFWQIVEYNNNLL